MDNLVENVAKRINRHFTNKKTDNTNSWWGTGAAGTSYAADGSVNWYNHFQNQLGIIY